MPPYKLHWRRTFFTRFFRFQRFYVLAFGNGLIPALVIRRPLSTTRGHPTTLPSSQAQPLCPAARRSCALRSFVFVLFESFIASPNLELASFFVSVRRLRRLCL